MKYDSSKEQWPREWGEWLHENADKMSHSSLYENFRTKFGIRNWKKNWMYTLYDWFGVKYPRKYRDQFTRYRICFNRTARKLGIDPILERDKIVNRGKYEKTND